MRLFTLQRMISFPVIFILMTILLPVFFMMFLECFQTTFPKLIPTIHLPLSPDAHTWRLNHLTAKQIDARLWQIDTRVLIINSFSLFKNIRTYSVPNTHTYLHSSIDKMCIDYLLSTVASAMIRATSFLPDVIAKL